MSDMKINQVTAIVRRFHVDLKEWTCQVVSKRSIPALYEASPYRDLRRFANGILLITHSHPITFELECWAIELMQQKIDELEELRIETFGNKRREKGNSNA